LIKLASIKQLELSPIVAAVSAGRPHQIAQHHGEHGTVAGGELAGHVDDKLDQLIAARDTLAGSMCPRGD
jgi:hypothetical protein